MFRKEKSAVKGDPKKNWSWIKAKLRSLGSPSFDVRLTKRFVTHFEPYDHRQTSKNECRNAKTVAL